MKIPEDLIEDYTTAKNERNNPSRPKPWHDTMDSVISYIERIARLEEQIRNSKKIIEEGLPPRKATNTFRIKDVENE